MNCPVCQKEMYDNRVGKKNPKAPDYRCKDKNCKFQLDPKTKNYVPSQFGTGVWVGTPKQQEIYHSADKLPPIKDVFQGTKNETTNVTSLAPQKEEKMSKEDWQDRDASIASLALCKVKAVAGGYRGLEGVVIDNINEEIYNDYIFFLNRLSKELP